MLFNSSDKYLATNIPTRYAYGVSESKKSEKLIDTAFEYVKNEITNEIISTKNSPLSKEQKQKITEKVIDKIKNDKDLSEIYKENENPFYHFINNKVEKTHRTSIEKFIPTPRLKVTDEGVIEYGFVDFDLDSSKFNQVNLFAFAFYLHDILKHIYIL